MIKNYFNVSRYKKLLKLEEDGKILPLDVELWNLKPSIAGQLSYNRKKDYFILINKYLNRSILPSQFRDEILQMGKED